MSAYIPPFTITGKTVRLVSEITETTTRLVLEANRRDDLRLRKVNRVRTIQGSLAIEGNSLSVEQITAILEGKRVLAPAREVQEVYNALEAYDRLPEWNPASLPDLLAAHGVLTAGLLEESGVFRKGGVGVVSENTVLHVAPQADRVPFLMRDLMDWLAGTEQHPLIASCVFHYEFEFIHPFADGNGRVGRLWQTLILGRWREILGQIPVENMVWRHQQDYYQAIGASTQKADSSPFIEFMLEAIRTALDEYPADALPPGGSTLR